MYIGYSETFNMETTQQNITTNILKMDLHEIDAAFFFIFTTLVTARAALATA